jgi:hypothetical protein
MLHLNKNKPTPNQEVIAKIVALFTQVTDRSTALQAAKHASALMTESGYLCTMPFALEALAAYQGARNWDTLSAQLPKGAKTQNHVSTTSEKNSMLSTTDTKESRSLQIMNWLAEGDTGISSEVLAMTSIGLKSQKCNYRAPADDSDCSRCEHLAKACPFVVEALPELIEQNPKWSRWADRIRQAATPVSVDAVHTNNRFKVGQSAFLRHAMMHCDITAMPHYNTTIPAHTKVAIKRVPGVGETGQTDDYLVTLSNFGIWGGAKVPDIHLVLKENQLLTRKDLDIQRIHNFANGYAQDLFYNLYNWVTGFDFNEGYTSARKGSSPNEQVIYFYKDGDGSIELSQTIVADQDGGYTILTPQDNLPKDWNNPSLPSVKVKAGTSPQDAACQVMEMFSENLKQIHPRTH